MTDNETMGTQECVEWVNGDTAHPKRRSPTWELSIAANGGIHTVKCQLLGEVWSVVSIVRNLDRHAEIMLKRSAGDLHCNDFVFIGDRFESQAEHTIQAFQIPRLPRPNKLQSDWRCPISNCVAAVTGAKVDAFGVVTCRLGHASL